MENQVATAKTRYYEFDFLRAVCVMALPFVHTAEELQFAFKLTGPAETLISVIFLLCFGVACFVALFGTNLEFASQKPAGFYFYRGLKFLLLGMALNVCRFVIPYYLFGAFNSTLDFIHYGLPTLLTSDIYDYFGAFLVLYALFLKLRLSHLAMLAVTIVLHLVAQQFYAYSSGNPYLDLLFGRIWTVNEDSYFPVLIWSYLPVCGILLAKRYKTLADEDKRSKFLKTMTFAGTVATVICFLVLKTTGQDIVAVLDEEDYHTTIMTHLTFLSLAAGFGGAMCLLYFRIRESAVVKFALKISATIMPFYFLHFILVGWLAIASQTILGKDFVVSAHAIAISSLAIFVLTSLISLKYGKALNRLLR